MILSGGCGIKKILSVVLIVAAIILVGCGSKYSDETFIKENASWVEDKDKIADFLDVAETMDKDFFLQLYVDGKIKGIDKETKVAVTGELNDGKILLR